ncbi:hypothetical protein [Nakamurella antarctica]|uniref:hypothetical protein n=1 Tax=Nakamurella antarctica TaxID=1902245 RepID=UPI0013DE3262|nr:hypothetical protein [Nakamurella antarctica]
MGASELAASLMEEDAAGVAALAAGVAVVAALSLLPHAANTMARTDTPAAAFIMRNFICKYSLTLP